MAGLRKFDGSLSLDGVVNFLETTQQATSLENYNCTIDENRFTAILDDNSLASREQPNEIALEKDAERVTICTSTNFEDSRRSLGNYMGLEIEETKNIAMNEKTTITYEEFINVVKNTQKQISWYTTTGGEKEEYYDYSSSETLPLDSSLALHDRLMTNEEYRLRTMYEYWHNTRGNRNNHATGKTYSKTVR